MVISPRHALSDAEKKFCALYLATGNAAKAYRESFPKQASSLDTKSHSQKGLYMLKIDYIKKFIDWCSQSSNKVAEQIEHEEMLFGDEAVAAKAANNNLQRGKKKDAMEGAVDVWAKHVLKKAVATKVLEDGTVLNEDVKSIFGFSEDQEEPGE